MDSRLDINGGHSSLVPEKRFVAMFDVLGFKQLVATMNLSDLFAKYKHLAERATHDNGVIVLWDEPSGQLGGGVFRFPCLVFSDTLVLWCDDKESAVDSFLSSCSHLVMASVESEMPLRGGIAYGECICDAPSGTVLGRAVVDAHVTEASQDWIGAALHPSCMKRKEWLDDCIRYSVPTKPGCPGLDVALAWHYYRYDVDLWLSDLKNVAPPQAHTKYDNAIQFVRANKPS